LQVARRAAFTDQEITMANAIRLTVPRIGEEVLATSRQVWLATLGAASVAREWVGNEAGPLFRTLAAEGANVESKAVHRLGTKLESRIARGNRLIRSARATFAASLQAITRAAGSRRREATSAVSPVKPRSRRRVSTR
jgi:hypothetical protein